MKKRFAKIFSAALALVMSLGLTACGGGTNPDNPGSNVEEKIDTSRTQLYVFNFYGGYGSDWLAAAKKRYEKLHENDVYEEGKKGIQIYINNQKSQVDEMQTQILDNRDEVYFAEYAYYYTLKTVGVLGDITEAVTADLSAYGDASGKTIESKLTAEQKNYYGIVENGTTRYYGIPHYSGYSGLTYNVDLFEEKGYYFAKTPAGTNLEDYFIYNKTDARSAGPDGEYGTDDDGLPATYDEFYKLCDYIVQDHNTPIVWTGANHRDYLNNLMQALVADYEGLDQMMLNYSFNGQASNLGKISGGNFAKDSVATTITEQNGYELSRQAGKYYGLRFIEKLVKTSNYHNELAFNSSYSHMNAQEDFLYAGHDGQTDPIAMLCDGIWWASEATSTFSDMSQSMGESYSKKGRNFAFMPLPKADASASKKSTLFDHIYSICFMKANIADWKKPIALDFIKFCNSDASLVEFTQITDTPKALNYTMTEAEMNEMSPYGRSIMKLKQKSDIVYPYSTTTLYKNNQGRFGTHSMYYSTTGGRQYQWAPNAFNEDKVSAADYFSGMYAYYANDWKTLVS